MCRTEGARRRLRYKNYVRGQLNVHYDKPATRHASPAIINELPVTSGELYAQIHESKHEL